MLVRASVNDVMDHIIAKFRVLILRQGVPVPFTQVYGPGYP